MAKTPIYDQSQALSAYFNDMLTTPAPLTKTAVSEVTAPPPHTQAPANNDMLDAETAIDTSDAVAPPESLRLLLFAINDIKLALPVSSLNNVVRWPEQGLNILPQQADWQLGVFEQKPQNSRVVDLSAFLQTESQLLPSSDTNYILLIAEYQWGIACQHIHQVASYQSSTAINWQHNQSQTTWCKGVIIEGNYQIIDVPALIATLDQS